MRIVQINLTYNIGSTGHIVADLDDVIRRNGDESIIVCGYTNQKKDNVYSMQTLPTFLDLRKDIALSRISGRMGYRSKSETKKVIKIIEKFSPDIIHLHNIHGDYINIKMLFDYIRAKNTHVVWTLHDCWSFTGRCSHFELNNCLQWKDGCNKCPKTQFSVYPITYFRDCSKSMWKDKKALFSNLDNLTVVTPSKWLANYVKQSFLKVYPCQVINNGINLDIYKPANTVSKYLAGNNKKIILGVAASWTDRKGLADLIALDSKIDHQKYQIVVVGLNSRQMKTVPESILKIQRTNNAQELVELYTAATVLVNPTYQDNYPTVNLEALACGTKVITYKTGGSPESVPSDLGYIVNKGDQDELYEQVMEALESDKEQNKCVDYARIHFDKAMKYDEYIKLYKRVLK